jgi:hypothetical protein
VYKVLDFVPKNKAYYYYNPTVDACALLHFPTSACMFLYMAGDKVTRDFCPSRVDGETRFFSLHAPNRA